MSERCKGSSLMNIIPNYTVIDIETTGLDPRYDEIIELAAVKVRDFQVVDEFQALIEPTFPIDEFITQKTGITNEMLKGQPIIEAMIPEFLNFIGDDIVVGHNVNFDINFVYDNSKHIKEFDNDFIDNLRLVRKIYPEFENHRLDTVMKYLEVDPRTIHRALNDCHVTNECFIKTVRKIESEGIDLRKTSCKPRKSNSKINLATLEPLSPDQISSDHICYDKYFCFTGSLENFTRKEAAQIVVNMGGIAQNNVNKQTNYLILGNFDYSKIKDDKSIKLKKAESLYLSGHEIQILSENVFLDIIKDN
ncbi:BRCT domain-containing protein [Alkalibacter saccharofermentans]|uniref:DNA polymerase-3 subunit epsilon n=1 Tax=Alkalibacter saccharofermentans DSM 14828 TaxID=1120975 RepID=A0A1M4ZHQ6_9FIRM|nr:BRCT domain-containing protein [Alkalibacter saccharofermentans]SHF17515.1 DNA polymerase-3 subunit epsilon [Alkalibacter saccharofermentans DSM 14828]